MRIKLKLMIGASVFLVASGGTTSAFSQTMGEMRRMLEEQQRMIEQMQRQQEEMRRQYEQMQHRYDADKKAIELEASSGKAAVVNKNDNIKLSISGQVNSMVTVSNDGSSTDVFFVDNDNSSTRLKVEGVGKIDDDMKVGAVLEFEMQANPSNNVSQDNQSPDGSTFDLDGRKAEVYFHSDAYGRLAIGQGSTASDGTAEVDLSGTDVIQYSSIVDQAGGLKFYDNTANAYDLQIKDAFNNFDGNSRTTRIRYDTPTFAGFFAAGSVEADEDWSVAAGYQNPKDLLEGFALQAAVGYSGRDSGTQRLNGSASILHEDSGLSFTVSSGTDFKDQGSDPWGLYVKPGWQTSNLTSIGTTAFSVDYGLSEDVASASSRAHTAGIAAVQNWKKYGVQFYTGFRWHSLDETGAEYDDIYVLSVGTRAKF